MTLPVRSLAPLLLIGLAAAPASADACPRGALCIIAEPARDELAAPAPPPRSVRLQVELRVPAESLPSVRFSAERAVASSSSEQMPWIWAALRAHVYARLPTQKSESLTLTLAPVVVQGQYDTLPGIGVSGAFD